MKKIPFIAAFLFAAVAMQAQNAEDVVAKHLAAIGADNWAKYNSVKMDADITSGAAAGMKITWSLTAIRDKAARMDISVMGMNQIVVINQDSGWSTNPFMGKTDPEPLTADEVGSMKDMTDIDGSLVGYKEKGYTLEYVGTEDVDGVDAIKIKINKGKKTEYSFFDPETYYEIKNVTVEEVDGKEVEQTTIYSNFQKQGGIMVPMTMQQDGPMGATTITMTSIVFNPTIDATIFDMPKK